MSNDSLIIEAAIDYYTCNEKIQFDKCDTRKCVNITIINDDIVEKYEHFEIKLMTYAPKVNINRPRATVRIVSNESKNPAMYCSDCNFIVIYAYSQYSWSDKFGEDTLHC